MVKAFTDKESKQALKTFEIIVSWVLEKKMRKNLFLDMKNEKLQECFDSYKRVLCNRKQENELFEELSFEYRNIVECDELKRESVSRAMCSSDMFFEIARRFFQICKLVSDKDFCELFGISQEKQLDF